MFAADNKTGTMESELSPKQTIVKVFQIAIEESRKAKNKKFKERIKNLCEVDKAIQLFIALDENSELYKTIYCQAKFALINLQRKVFDTSCIVLINSFSYIEDVFRNTKLKSSNISFEIKEKEVALDVELILKPLNEKEIHLKEGVSGKKRLRLKTELNNNIDNIIL